jgi:hypothetical protein
MTEVHVERHVNCPFSVAEQYVSDYLERAAKGGPEATLRLPLVAGSVAISKNVEFSFDRKHDDHDPGRTHLESVIIWKSGARLLPNFSGVIRTRIAAPGTLLIVAGRYCPPLGFFGTMFDRLIGRRLAQATVRDLAERLGRSLESREARWREHSVSAN